MGKTGPVGPQGPPGKSGAEGLRGIPGPVVCFSETLDFGQPVFVIILFSGFESVYMLLIFSVFCLRVNRDFLVPLAKMVLLGPW